MSYDVVLLVEQALSELDASQVHGLHADFEEPVRYHLLLPIEDTVGMVESGLTALAGGEILAAPASVLDAEDIAEMRQEMLDKARDDVSSSVELLEKAGATATGRAVSSDPISALVAAVADVDAREAIILTRPHVVSEFFHVDWTSRARRKLGVPVLHLLEHETFDEQAGEGEGISGF